MSGRSAALVDRRRQLIFERLREHGSVSVAALQNEFGISPMTARRDLDQLEREGLARRTHGGAVLPGLSSHEDSFQRRLASAVQAKERLAQATVRLLQPGEAIFIDGSSTAYVAARRIVRENLRCTILTNSVPIMDLVTEIDAPQVDLVATGGSLRKLTRSLVGPQAIRSIEAHFADRVIFSARSVTPQGRLTDPDPLEAEVKRSMIARAGSVVLLIDGSKFALPALTEITTLEQVDVLLAADAPDEKLAPFRTAGLDVRSV